MTEMTNTPAKHNGKNSVDLDAVERAIAERGTVDGGDPALSVVELATKRLDALLAEVTDSTIDELRQLRDLIDNTMRTILARQQSVRETFAGHVECATQAMAFKTIAAEHLEKVRARFADGLGAVGQTVTTQLKQ